MMDKKYQEHVMNTYEQLREINKEFNQLHREAVDKLEEFPGILTEIRNQNIETIQLIEKYMHRGVFPDE